MTKRQKTVVDNFKSLNLNDFEIIADRFITFRNVVNDTTGLYRIRIFDNGSMHIKRTDIYSDCGTIQINYTYSNYRFISLDHVISGLKSIKGENK